MIGKAGRSDAGEEVMGREGRRSDGEGCGAGRLSRELNRADSADTMERPWFWCLFHGSEDLETAHRAHLEDHWCKLGSPFRLP